MRNVDGRVAVVTGAASGIGLATAHLLAEAGMKLVLADIEQGALVSAASSIESTGADVLAVPCDVTSSDQVNALADASFQRFGGVHVVFINAGVITTGAALRMYAWEGSLADWEWTLSVNLMGVVHGVRAFLPRMLEAGEEGHIVNTASIAGLLPGANPYDVSKNAVVCLTEGLYRDLREIGAKLSASVVCPRGVNTQIVDGERNRPAMFGQRMDLATVRPEVRKYATWFEKALRAALSPEEVAADVLHAIRNDRFYVVPAPPELLAQVTTRVTALLEHRNPDPT